MTTRAENQLLPNTGKIMLFYSNQSESCINYMKENWPNLVKAAKSYNPDIKIREIDVTDPKNQQDGGPLKYHGGGEIPNTVFISKTDQFLFAFRRNLSTKKLVQEFEGIKNITPQPKQIYGYKASYRHPENGAPNRNLTVFRN